MCFHHDFISLYLYFTERIHFLTAICNLHQKCIAVFVIYTVQKYFNHTSNLIHIGLIATVQGSINNIEQPQMKYSKRSAASAEKLQSHSDLLVNSIQSKVRLLDPRQFVCCSLSENCTYARCACVLCVRDRPCVYVCKIQNVFECMITFVFGIVLIMLVTSPVRTAPCTCHVEGTFKLQPKRGFVALETEIVLEDPII